MSYLLRKKGLVVSILLCRYDNLRLYNGNSTDSGRLEFFDGSLPNLPMVTTYDTSQMLLRFQSDRSSTYSGFNITYNIGKFTILKMKLEQYAVI